MAIALFLCASCSIKAQHVELMDSVSLDTVHMYTDLSLALKEPDKVIRISLRKQKLKEFPAAILQFKNLQYLDLSKNSIKEIPEQIGLLQNLQYFAISRNKVESFPPEIGQLKNLRWLIMNQNELTLLPPQIGNLEKLEYLDLWSNNLDHFPEEMKNLKKLKVLDLRVILITDSEQGRIVNMLPNSLIYFSANCNCKN
jgi:Leucine-rich repeat (LRR) protein